MHGYPRHKKLWQNFKIGISSNWSMAMTRARKTLIALEYSYRSHLRKSRT